jgi:hypothetical protein
MLNVEKWVNWQAGKDGVGDREVDKKELLPRPAGVGGSGE